MQKQEKKYGRKLKIAQVKNGIRKEKKKRFKVNV
jgi:hypothetical protein